MEGEIRNFTNQRRLDEEALNIPTITAESHVYVGLKKEQMAAKITVEFSPLIVKADFVEEALSAATSVIANRLEEELNSMQGREQ